MGEVLFGGGVALGAGALAWFLRARRTRILAVERLNQAFVTAEEAEPVIEPAPALPRYPWLPPLVAVTVAAGMWLVLGWPAIFCTSVGLLVLVLGVVLEVNSFESRCLRVENQLADAIDMIVGALGAGAGATDAMQSAAREAPAPLDRELHNLTARIQYGEAPGEVFDDLAARVPLETFELFAFTLAVHEETGGSLSSTLATVGRTIRDRIELRRRVRAQATEAQASVIGILFIIYGIALITWRTNPERTVQFVSSDVGINLVSASMILQSVGLLWMFRLTRFKY